MLGPIRRVELLLFLRKTFFTNHTKSEDGVKRSLGTHLMAVYDLLAALDCDADVCTAGALHSIYGTSIFKKVTISANKKNRVEIQLRFGHRAERLAFLFHSCKRSSPNNIETGILYDRTGRFLISGVTFDDIQALRLIEAANMLDQYTRDHLRKRLPNVFNLWVSQEQLRNHFISTQPRIRNFTRKLIRGRDSLIIRLKVHFYDDGGEEETARCSEGKYMFLSLKSGEDYVAIYKTFANFLEEQRNRRPAATNDVLYCSSDGDVTTSASASKLLKEEMITTCDGSNGTSSSHTTLEGRTDRISTESDPKGPRISSTPLSYPPIVFTLRGEAAMGMSWSPLWMLYRFLFCDCHSEPGLIFGDYSPALEIDVKYLRRECSADSQVMYGRLSALSRGVNQARPGPPSIAIASITTEIAPHCTLVNNGTARVIDSMLTYGYAVISVDDVATRTIAKAFAALLRFQEDTSVADKRNTFDRIDGERYIGWTKDAAREWLQMRVISDAAGRSVPLRWPESFAPEDRSAIEDAVALLSVLAGNIFEEIGVLLKLGSRAYLRSLCWGAPVSGLGEHGVSSAHVGSSVCRQFVYLDNLAAPVERENDTATQTQTQTQSQSQTQSPTGAADSKSRSAAHSESVRKSSDWQPTQNVFIPAAASGCHADMGLITLSPCSTIPALNMLHPATHDVLYPEEGLRPNEWVLFAGETLSFLSAGAIEAPLHSVPHINRETLRTVDGSDCQTIPPMRRSMPFFLRADPEAFLHPVSDVKWDVSSTTATQQGDKLQRATSGGSALCAQREVGNGVSATTCEQDETKTESGSENALRIGATAVRGRSDKKFVLSPHAMRCRAYMESHSIGPRPWRLDKNSGDF